MDWWLLKQLWGLAGKEKAIESFTRVAHVTVPADNVALNYTFNSEPTEPEP